MACAAVAVGHARSLAWQQVFCRPVDGCPCQSDDQVHIRACSCLLLVRGRLVTGLLAARSRLACLSLCACMKLPFGHAEPPGPSHPALSLGATRESSCLRGPLLSGRSLNEGATARVRNVLSNDVVRPLRCLLLSCPARFEAVSLWQLLAPGVSGVLPFVSL